MYLTKMALSKFSFLQFFVVLQVWLAGARASPVWPSNASAPSTCAGSMNGQLPSATPADFHFSGNVRRYYVAAEEVEWDYAPTGWDNWLGVCTSLNVSSWQALTLSRCR